MPEYHVEWAIELDADSPREAAQEALTIQRDPDSIAVVFDVIEFDVIEFGNGESVRIDLLEEEEDEVPIEE